VSKRTIFFFDMVTHTHQLKKFYYPPSTKKRYSF